MAEAQDDWYTPPEPAASAGADDWQTPQGSQASTGETAADIAKSAAIGVPRGVVGMAGLPEQVAGLTAAGIEKGAGLLGYRPEDLPGFLRRDPEGTRLRTTQQIQQAAEDVTGPWYEPKTTAGRYAETVGEFVPAAALGPGGMARRIATQAVVPGLASEAAGQATAGTAAEPWARGVTALATGMRGVRASDVAAAGAATKALLAKGGEAEAGTKGLYGAFDQAAKGAPVDYKTMFQLKNGMRADLNNLPYDTSLAEKLITKLQPRDVSDLAIWRQGMRQTLYDKGMGAAAKVLTDNIDNAIERSLPRGHVGVGMLQEADRQFALTKLAQSLDKRIGTVEAQTAATHSGANLDNKIRQALVAFSKDERAVHGLTPQEQVTLQNIIRGGMTANTLRRVGNVLGGGGGMGMTVGALLGHMLLGGAGFVGFPAAGALLKATENALVHHQVRNLISDVAERSMFAPTVGRLRPPPLYSRAGRGVYYGGFAPQQTPEGYDYYQAVP